jgi:hypothetical protein
VRISFARRRHESLLGLEVFNCVYERHLANKCLGLLKLILQEVLIIDSTCLQQSILLLGVPGSLACIECTEEADTTTETQHQNVAIAQQDNTGDKQACRC